MVRIKGVKRKGKELRYLCEIGKEDLPILLSKEELLELHNILTTFTPVDKVLELKRILRIFAFGALVGLVMGIIVCTMFIAILVRF